MIVCEVFTNKCCVNLCVEPAKEFGKTGISELIRCEVSEIWLKLKKLIFTTQLICPNYP